MEVCPEMVCDMCPSKRVCPRRNELGHVTCGYELGCGGMS